MTDARQPRLNSGTANILRWLGFGLIFFAVADVLTLLYPPNFTNPEWEFRLIGNLVERSPVPLIGFALVFLSSALKQKPERPLEALSLKISSYACLVAALLFVLLVPLGISDTFRLSARNTERLDEQLQQSIEQIDRFYGTFSEQVTQAAPDNVLRRVQQFQATVAAAQQQNPQQNIDPQVITVLQLMQDLPEDPAAAKTELLSRMETESTSQKASITTRVNDERSRARRDLLENSVKWNLEALLAAVLFLMMYFQTDAIRKLPLRKKAPPVADL